MSACELQLDHTPRPFTVARRATQELRFAKEPEMAWFAIDPWLEHIVHETLGENTRFTARVTCDDVRLMVVADRDWLERVIVSLVGDAQEAMPRGGSLDVRIRPAGDFVKISITDNAIPSRRDVALAHAVVTRMGGRMMVHSETSAGTTFTLWLRNGALT